MGRPSKTSPVWVSTTVIAELVGCSYQHLHNLRESGFFKSGTHYRDISRPNASKPTYRWHIKNCEEAFSIPPEHR